MPRIRNIYPALFSDSRYMRLSDAAARVLPGIWVEADDNGIFRWEPDTLRARVVPMGSHDMEAILSELESADWIRRFERDGTWYGACRNFKVYQKTKHPSERYSDVLPAEMLSYINGKTKYAPRSGEPSPEAGEASPYKGSKGKESKGGGDGSVEPPPASLGGPDWTEFTAAADNPEIGRVLYGPACDWLHQKSGGTRDSISALITKWTKAAGDKASALRLMQNAARTRVGDPKAYISAAVRDLAARSGRTPSGDLKAGVL